MLVSGRVIHSFHSQTKICDISSLLTKLLTFPHVEFLKLYKSKCLWRASWSGVAYQPMCTNHHRNLTRYQPAKTCNRSISYQYPFNFFFFASSLMQKFTAFCGRTCGTCLRNWQNKARPVLGCWEHPGDMKTPHLLLDPATSSRCSS